MTTKVAIDVTKQFKDMINNKSNENTRIHKADNRCQNDERETLSIPLTNV